MLDHAHQAAHRWFEELCSKMKVMPPEDEFSRLSLQTAIDTADIQANAIEHAQFVAAFYEAALWLYWGQDLDNSL